MLAVRTGVWRTLRVTASRFVAVQTKLIHFIVCVGVAFGKHRIRAETLQIRVLVVHRGYLKGTERGQRSTSDDVRLTVARPIVD